VKLILATVLAALIAAAFTSASAMADTTKKISPARERVVKTLDATLAGTPMQRTGRELEAAGWKHGVHPAFIAAIAGTESSYGRLACRSNRYNAFGLSSCGTGWRVPDFRSWAQAYDFMARFLTGRTTVTSGWPNARTPYDYRGYAASSSKWGAAVSYHMERFGLGTNVRYGR